MGIRRWVAIMQSLSTLQEQAPVYISQPLSPLGSPAGEGDWQTLTQVQRPAFWLLFPPLPTLPTAALLLGRTWHPGARRYLLRIAT